MGGKSVTTDDNGNDTFFSPSSQTLAELHSTTATANDPDGNTSEFSTAQVVV